MATPDKQPWWIYTREEQKRQIEEAVDWYLARPGKLSDRHKMLLRDAMAHTFRGHFGAAFQDIYDLNLPDNVWPPSVGIDPTLIAGVDRAALRRMLAALKASAAQSRSVFR